MADLFNYSFGRGDDVARSDFWLLSGGRLVSTDKGNDIITGILYGSEAESHTFSGCSLINRGFISTNSGRDRIILEQYHFSLLVDGSLLSSVEASARSRLVNRAEIDLGSGDDELVASNDGTGGDRSSIGAINNGFILTRSGNDSLSFAGYNGLLNRGVIQTGSGDDSLKASGFTNLPGDNPLADVDVGPIEGSTGLVNVGRIEFGPGSDSILASGLRYGLVNFGDLFLGADDDRIQATGYVHGLRNTGVISLGSGDDYVRASSGVSYIASGLSAEAGLVNYGVISANSGNDVIEFSSLSGPSLVNTGQIHMGAGNDVLRNVSPAPYDSIFSNSGVKPLKNLGLIAMGPGDDLVDSLISPGSPGVLPDPGFVGGGLIDMGSGQDTFRGYGVAKVLGGDGVDTLILPIGTYAITPLPGERFRLGSRMTVSGFERFGEGADRVSFAEAVVAGSVTFS